MIINCRGWIKGESETEVVLEFEVPDDRVTELFAGLGACIVDDVDHSLEESAELALSLFNAVAQKVSQGAKQ